MLEEYQQYVIWNKQNDYLESKVILEGQSKVIMFFGKLYKLARKYMILSLWNIVDYDLEFCSFYTCSAHGIHLIEGGYHYITFMPSLQSILLAPWYESISTWWVWIEIRQLQSLSELVHNLFLSTFNRFSYSFSSGM